MTKFSRLLQFLADEHGYRSTGEMLADTAGDSVAPAICTKDGCEYTEEMEPDQDAGWCPECGTHSMKSCLVLAGVV